MDILIFKNIEAYPNIRFISFVGDGTYTLIICLYIVNIAILNFHLKKRLLYISCMNEMEQLKYIKKIEAL